MKEKYIITLHRPKEVSVTEMNNYIRDAVSAWGGQFRPDDPLFGFRENVLAVKRVVKEKP